MIINGGSRSNGAFFARHLMRADENERVTITDMRGLGRGDLPLTEAFRRMEGMAEQTRCKNYFYHANINTRTDEVLTPEQWARAVDKLERALHLEGQPRFIVEHQKEGRTHCHVVWSRIDSDTATTISDSLNYRTHERVAAELETAFGHQATDRALTRDKATERPEPNVKDWESFRAAESGIDPKAIKAELTDLWRHSDTGPAFAAALAERGYILARGDRRDFCVIDQAGDEHSLSRRLAGVKAAEVRSRMEGIDRGALPSVEEARTLARARPQEPLSPFDAVMLKTVQDERAYRAGIERLAEASAPEILEAELTEFDLILAQTVRRAAQESIRAAQAERDTPGAAFEQFRAWCGVLWGHLASWGETLREQFKDLLHPAPEPERRDEATYDRDMEVQL